MDEEIRAKLEEANKLIFVKQYTEAEKILQGLIRTPARHGNLLVHLRAVELAAKLGKLDAIKRFYLTEHSNTTSPELLEICLAFVEQNSEEMNYSQCMARFQDIVVRFGPSAAGFYGIGFCLEAQQSHDRAAFNYEQSIGIDPTWYPSYFGLSQIAYHKSDEKKGDQYFFQYEQSAPYNVYGNFETHRKLSREFESAGRFIEAEAAVTSLSDWWRENKGFCPPEIQIFELLSRSRIAKAQGDIHGTEYNLQRAKALGQQMILSTNTHDNILYFTARQFDEHGDTETAFRFYKHILRVAGGNPQVVQRIGGQFLASGEYELARTLFEEAYEVHPENTEVRFCRLVAQLKLAKVNVEDYLIGKERLRQLIQSHGDRVEILALLHSLLAKFQNDPEVHYRIGEVYARLGNIERATRHFRKMFELDSKSRRCRLKLAAFLMQHGDPDEAKKNLDEIGRAGGDTALDREEQSEVGWLKASYYARKGDFAASQIEVQRVAKIDPWNVAYVVQEVVNLTHIHSERHSDLKVDETITKLARAQEQEIVWEEFDAITARVEGLALFDLAFSRRKIRFLYAHGEEGHLDSLIKTAAKFDAARAMTEFMRLLNTNFDSPFIYYALGMVSKELWQLETACMWLEQVIQSPTSPKHLISRSYIEYADALAWQGQNTQRAVEYAKLAIDMGDQTRKPIVVLAHAYLKNGQVREAQEFVERVEDGENDPEAKYIKGLILYRNGAALKANQMWKPLLSRRSENSKDHHMKQEILKFYFEGAPYLKAN